MIRATQRQPLRIAYADGPDGALPPPEQVLDAAGRGRGVRAWASNPESIELFLGWVVREPPWIAGALGAEVPIKISTFLVGAGTRRAVASGVVDYVPLRLSTLSRLFSGRLRQDIVVVGAWEDGGSWRLAGSPGWALAAVRASGRVVVERWPGKARPGQPLLPECEVLGVVERAEPADPAPTVRSGPVQLAIGRHVAGLIPPRATLQWGPGAIGAAVVSCLDTPVSVHSGLVTDELADLEARGLLTGPARAAYVWGGESLSAMIAGGRLELIEVSESHDLTAVSSIERFVAVNTAVQVGLDGSVNVESAGGRIVAGPGGHPDFAVAASASRGGLSVVAMASTAGGHSTIVARPDVVSTPRSDVDVVVTEYGVADLRGCSDSERAARMMSICHPDYRKSLENEGSPSR